MTILVALPEAPGVECDTVDGVREVLRGVRTAVLVVDAEDEGVIVDALSSWGWPWQREALDELRVWPEASTGGAALGGVYGD